MIFLNRHREVSLKMARERLPHNGGISIKVEVLDTNINQAGNNVKLKIKSEFQDEKSSDTKIHLNNKRCSLRI